ncbi:hypothetical protein [Lacticaseibacillus paracasei]|uniref:hypothetical protein n=1 Tax=Lacticaseibacillus paracasei TaxID=1597 RepID=UPI000C2D5285|nr:hypothetical protein [Lacticaseibacillus paracasei]AUC00913.1 hypothetical protein BBD24_08060 [Lacticaseibacillus paracasei subsp. paracasei]MDH7442601.1 hypothetical protein [Lacticaseibacillus paracasei subsp. paracasei]
MAKSQDQFNEKVGKEINVSDEAVDKAAAQIEKVGYVTEKDVPEMIDRDYTRALSNKVSAKLHKDNDDDYFYEEPFDYENGRIANIMWDMDKIKTREEAMKILADELGLTVPKIVMRKIDEQVF